MNKYIIVNGELYHFGIKGMKWGVRRFQNKDGGLTNAGKKRLVRSLRRDYKNSNNMISESYKQTVKSALKKNITNDDKQRINDAKRKWLDMMAKSDKAELELSKLGDKYGREHYNEMLKKHADVYDTPRRKQKLLEYAIYDYGYDQALKERPDLDKLSRAGDESWEMYSEECRKVADKILGKYGAITLTTRSKRKRTIRETVGEIVKDEYS